MSQFPKSNRKEVRKMEKELKQNIAEIHNADAAHSAEPAAQRKAWHRPVITRIDIKRTMALAGSAPDASVGTI